MTIFRFDRIAAIGLAVLPATARAQPLPAPGEWVMADRSNAQGGRTVSASLIARDGASRLVVKCDIVRESIVSIQFIRPAPIGQSVEKPVAMRFDGGPAVTYNWEFPGAGAFIRDPAPITALTILLAKAKAIGIETTNDANFVVIATFDAPGSDAAIRQVLGTCGYALGVVPFPSAQPRGGGQR